MCRVYWQRVFIYLLNSKGIFQPCKQIQSILGTEALFLAYKMCRGLAALTKALFCLRFTLLFPPIFHIWGIYIPLPRESIGILCNHRFAWTSKRDCIGLWQVYRIVKYMAVECLSFQVTFMRSLISFWLQIHKLTKLSKMT